MHNIEKTEMSKLWHRNSKTLTLYSRIHMQCGKLSLSLSLFGLEWNFFTIRSCIGPKRKSVFQILAADFPGENLSELWHHFELLKHK